MSTEQKVQRVREARGKGTRLEPALRAVELPRSSWYYHKSEKVSYEEKYEWLRPLVEEIIAANPAYGVRRIKRELQEGYGHRVNHKVLRRLLKVWDLSLRQNVHRPKASGVRSAVKAVGCRADLVTGREDIAPFEVAVTDFTDLPYGGGSRTAKLMPVVGHQTKMAYGWTVGPRRNRELALRAWRQAKETFSRTGITCEGMIVHHDRDSVYLSFQWLSELLIEDGVRVSYAMRGAKDNTVMEAFNSSFKTEGESLFTEAEDVEELRRVVDRQMRYYNRQRRHSSIGYRSPAGYIRFLRQEEDDQ